MKIFRFLNLKELLTQCNAAFVVSYGKFHTDKVFMPLKPNYKKNTYFF